MRAIRLTSGAATLLTFALIVLGAVVRTTNSGLSCPDWPTCYGSWIPLPSHLEAVPNIGYAYWQVMLEWVHRLIAGVFLGPLILLLAVLTFANRKRARVLAWAGGCVLLLLFVQALLGGVTVLDKNSPWSVALHLGNALLLLTGLLFIVERTVEHTTKRHLQLGLMAVGAWFLALLAMMTAAVTAKMGASLACSTWPLCDGAIVPDLSDASVAMHFAHRALAGVVTLVLLALLMGARRHGRALGRLAGAAFLLVIVQVLLGASLIILQVPLFNAVLHQAVGVLTFAVVTLLMWRCLPLATARMPAGTLGDEDGLALRGA